jgi:adenosylcobinamide-GDP ribazoletransferase
MKKEVQIFLTAIMFFTRIPVGKNLPYHEGMLQQSARYFSWVGIIVGGFSACIFWLASYIFSTNLAIAFSMLASILLTGAFHEDGFADSCDAFGGGWNKEKILTIMKDSRLGTYGVIGLIGIITIKFLLLQSIQSLIHLPFFIASIIAAHSISRCMAVFTMQQLTYVQDIDSSKSKPLANRKLSWNEMFIALIGAFIPCVFLPTIFLLSIPLMIVVQYLAGFYFKKWIGGYTGDCLGATQQICEITFYIGILILLKFT